jgi:type VI secretion system protein ImpM
MDTLPALKPLATGWYGKLPSRGDFVGRGLPRALLRAWDGWLQRALAAAQQELGAAPLRERLAAMPPWQGLVLPQRPGDPVWSGVVVGSTDRVGRAFPLLLAEAFEPAGLGTVDLIALRARGDAMARWLAQARAGLAQKDLDAALAGWAAKPLACPAPDDTRPGCDVSQLRLSHPGASSFWWPAAAPVVAADFDARTAAWPPAEALMLEWLAASRPG